jgi:acetyl esterase
MIALGLILLRRAREVNMAHPADRTISWARSSPAELRAYHALEAAELSGALPADVIETALDAQGAFRGGLIFTPRTSIGDRALVYFHGGGFVAGSPETHRCVAAWLARLLGMPVLSARYRLAPEHPFPAQREDAIAACAAALSLGAEIFLAGDSAGACVALWGLLGLAPGLRARVKGLILFYGGYGLTNSGSILHYGRPENGLDSETLAIMYRRLGDRVCWPIDSAGDIDAPAYVLGAALDPVRDDSVRLFGSLRRQTSNAFVVVDGQDHGFLKTTGKNPVAMRELEKAAQWVLQIGAARS